MSQLRHPSEPAFLSPGSAAEASLPPRREPPSPGAIAARYALAGILGYLGAVKISPVVAQLIQPVVANSAALAWIYSYLSVEWAARAIGAVELGAALLLLASPFSVGFALAGSLAAVGIFVMTVSFLFTTPDIFMHLPGFPLPAPSTLAAFLLKDVFLLGVAAWSLVGALRSLRRRRRSS
jgi:uncharacterized membrane protein YkgB